MLRANLMAVCFMKIAGKGIFDLFCCCDLDLDPMTFIRTYLYSLEIGRMCKYKLLTSRLSKVIVGHTYITDTTEITGSAVALHCCKAHAKINRKMGNSTPCKIVTPENITLKLCICDYVGEMTHHANFGFNRCGGGLLPK